MRKLDLYRYGVPEIEKPYLTVKWEPSMDQAMKAVVARIMSNGTEFRVAAQPVANSG